LVGSNKLAVKNAYKSSQVALALLGILLEQGQQHIDHVKEKTKPMLWTLIPTLLGGVIISNAYKGENINQITAPLSPAKYDTWDAIKRNASKYTAHSSETDFNYSGTMYRTYRANHTLLNEIQSDMNEKDFVPKSLAVLNWLVSAQIPLAKDLVWCDKKSFRKQIMMKEMGRTPKNPIVFPDFLEAVCTWQGPLLQELIKCDNVAYFEKREFLELYLLPGLKYNAKPRATYSLGQEQIYLCFVEQLLQTCDCLK